jgi:hypothetical protein
VLNLKSFWFSRAVSVVSNDISLMSRCLARSRLSTSTALCLAMIETDLNRGPKDYQSLIKLGPKIIVKTGKLSGRSTPALLEIEQKRV